MSEWYYARNGQQSGPVSFEQLRELASSGGLHPVNDLVWNSTMKDWTPAGQVSGIFATPSQASVPAPDPSNPYAAPQSTWVEPVAQHSGDTLMEIVPGSEPIDAMACVKRGFDLAKRNASTLVIIFLVYFAVVMGLSMVSSVIQNVMIAVSQHGVDVHSSRTVGPVGPVGAVHGARQLGPVILTVIIIMQIVLQLAGAYLGLGLIRVCLNLVSGKPATVAMLFGEGKKLLRMVGASILFFLMFYIGLLFLIVPGVYLFLRYGFYMFAIVDRDLGVMDSFSYSSTLTTNSRMNLFVLFLLGFLMMLAGFLACCVGIFVATPVIYLSLVVAYRWMQYGHRAAMDHPGTQTPMLSGV